MLPRQLRYKKKLRTIWTWVFVTQKRKCVVNLKNHKPNFHNRPSCRLINTCKPEVGKIIKKILTKIVSAVRHRSVLSWRLPIKLLTGSKTIRTSDLGHHQLLSINFGRTSQGCNWMGQKVHWHKWGRRQHHPDVQNIPSVLEKLTLCKENQAKMWCHNGFFWPCGITWFVRLIFAIKTGKTLPSLLACVRDDGLAI
jgi:hypothetical protein